MSREERKMKDYFVSCAQMKVLEQNTDAAGLSYYQMMENAGRIAANRIVEITMASPIDDAHAEQECPVAKAEAAARYPWALDRPIRARVYCGKGNNGGDGYVVARLLQRQGWHAEIVQVDGEPATPDAIANCKLAMELGIPMHALDEVAAADAVTCENGTAPTDEAGTAPDVVVDAIYGTGFHGQLREDGAKAAAQIAEARAAGARIFALDIPSGMGGDLTNQAELDSRCVKADVTITFHAKKAVHLQDFAAEYCGEIITADIGIVDPARDAARDAVTPQPDATEKRFDLAAGEHYSFEDFVEIISRLRAPDGCPWDRAQTHETLKKYLLEETQEAADAIDNKDDANFCEELGDVLLQIVLNAQVGKERGAFTIEDVIQGISEKMIRRHPWVFGDMHVDTPEEGEKLWEVIKKKEKKEKAENEESSNII